MRAVNVLSVLLAAGGVGISIGQPAPRAYSALGADFTAGVEVAKPKGTAVAPSPGTITALHWETNTAGVGAGVFTLAAEVNGVAVCSLELDCITAASEDTACAAEFATGDDVHVTITASSCATLPLGVASLWMRLSP